MSNMQRQPRKLQYLKCRRCRNDRQKCTPTDRPWPGRRCDRCNKFDYPCLASVTARGELGRSLNVSRISQGKQPVPLGFNTEDCNNSVGYAAAQSGQPGFHTIENLSGTSNTSQSPPRTSLIERPSAEMRAPNQARPGCAKFFFTLNNTKWGPMESGHAGCANTLAQIFVACLYSEGCSNTAEVYNNLRRRGVLVAISQELEVMIQQAIAKGMSRDKAVKVVTADAIADISKGATEQDKSQSAVGYILKVTRTIREAERWLELVNAIGAPEILLIDAKHPKCLKIGEFGDPEDHSEIGDVTALECCPKRCPSLSVDRIVTKGTDEVFAKLKETLLAPELQLVVTCQRLSGLVPLIYRLLKTENNKSRVDEWCKAAPFFPPPFKDELNRVLKLPHPTMDMDAKDELSDLDSFLISEIPRRIKDVFGSRAFFTTAESSDGEEGTSEDGDDDGDSSPDEFPDSDQGEDDAAFDTAFDKDFCMQFQSADPFTSL